MEKQTKVITSLSQIHREPRPLREDLPTIEEAETPAYLRRKNADRIRQAVLESFQQETN